MTERRDMEPDDAMLEAASAWFLRLEAGDETAFDGFDEWLMADERHAVAFRDVEAAWSAVGQHAAKPELIIGRRDALARAGQVARRRYARAPWRETGRTSRMALAAATVVLAVVAMMPRSIEPEDVGAATASQVLYQTAFGESRNLTLPDNSRLSLDTQSAVAVAPSGRVVDVLRGQAYFEVAKDEARPFVVRAAGRRVVALGTEFNVALDAKAVSVTLVEGRVNVETSGPARAEGAQLYYALTPGEQLEIDGEGNVSTRHLADVLAATAWRRGKLVFRNEPLGEAAAQINRYSRNKLVIGDSATAHIRVSGVFNLGDADAFAEAVGTYLGVRVSRQKDLTLVLKSAPEG
ncbi:MAG: FecR domain-containing protein [Sphingomonadales bacterium]